MPDSEHMREGNRGMALILSEIIKDEIFEGADLLCGQSGLSNPVKRVSVFDCPYHEDLVSAGMIMEGDLFISCLEQFDSVNAEFWKFLKGMVRYHSAGLIVVYSGKVSLLTPDIISWCNENKLPLIIQNKTVYYADIMSAVNKCIASEDLNAINLLRLDKLKFAIMTDYEKNAVISAINQNFKKLIRTIYLKRHFSNERNTLKFFQENILCPYDTSVLGEYIILILSDADEKSLRHHTNAVTSQLKQHVADMHIGFSRIYPRLQLEKAIIEGEKAIRIAEASNIVQMDYDPLMSLPILLAQSHSQEERDFYNAYVERIANSVSEDMLPSMLRTIDCFVSCKGDYVKTAEIMHQHTNTIRYRVNRIRSVLGMDDDQIRFYETIALASKIRIIFDYDLRRNEEKTKGRDNLLEY